EEARGYFNTLEPAFRRLNDRCQDLLDLNQQAMLRAQDRAERQAAGAARATVSLALGALVLGFVYALNLSRALVAPLRRLAEAVREAIEKREAVAPEGERGLVSIPVDHRERCFRVRTAPLLRPGGPEGGGRTVAGTVTVLEDVTRLREVDRLKDDFISVA